MAKQIYLNIPVKDLDKSKSFFSELGFDFNPQFTDEKAGCLIIGENIYVMLLGEEFFKNFTKKIIANSHEVTEALIGISAETKDDVDKMITKVKKAGGKEYGEKSDHGWMYSRSFEDLDGHIWEVIYTNDEEMPEEMKNRK